MRDDPSVPGLVMRARIGDQAAWNRLVETYTPLLWSTCRRYRLSPEDSADVVQRVWMLLVEQLSALREPAALPGWLLTTTKRECLRLLRASQRHASRSDPLDDAASRLAADEDSTAVDRALLAAERDVALRRAFAELHPRCRRLLELLIREPPVPYADISAKLNMPIGSIGPTRARCLSQLRRSRALAQLLATEAETVEGGEEHARPLVDG
ncbi:MAG TPA: sigma-70 family RNA polymerase sigma factor [Actinomycetes bacterium]